MALAKQNVPIILAGGVDTKTDRKIVQPGRLLELENGRFTKVGTLQKRFGYDSYATTILGGTSISSGIAAAVFKDELLLMDGSKIYSYVPSSDAWADRGYLTSAGITSKQVIRNTATQSISDCATTLGVTIYAWEDSRGGVRASVFDQDSGLPIISDVLISSNGARPKCSATANYLFVHYVDNTTDLKVQRLNPLSPTAFEAAAVVAGDINTTNSNYDIAPYGTNLVLSYQTTGSVVSTGFLTSAGTIGTALEGFPSPIDTTDSGSGAIAVIARFEGDLNDGIFLFFHNTTDGLQCEIYNTDLTLASLTTVDSITTQVNQITACISGTGAVCWYEVNAASTYNVRIKSESITRAGAVTNAGSGNEFMRSVGISGKAVKDSDDNIYFVAAHTSTYQPTYFTIRHISLTRGLVVNKIAPLNASGGMVKRSTVSNLAPIDDDTFIFPALVKSRLVSESGALYGLVGVQATTLNFADPNAYQSKQLGENLHIAGGMLFSYDGKTAVEQGFNLFPENFSNAITTATGTLEAGTRQYTVVYEWTDTQGQVHQSAPGIALPVTNAANDKNTLTIPTLRITEKKTQADRSSVSIVLYRTKAGLTTFYRVSSVSSPTLNDVTTDTVTILDNNADSTIGSNQILYTTGGVLENIQPASCKVVEDYRGRLVTDVLEDPTLTQYSRNWVKDEGVFFNDALNFRLAQDGGAITAYKVMDEKLIIFKDSQIYAQVGNGPTDSGELNDFQVPQLITSDVGCPFPRSIVTYPDGIIFKSKKGYYALSRSLQTTYIGAPVEDFNDLTVRGAILVDEENEVRFIHSDGVQLFYDYFTQQWGTDTGLEGEAAVMWQQRPVILQSNGVVLVENTSSFKDSGSSIKMKFVTPWISMAGLQGAQRIYRALFLGELKSEHLLRIKVSYDFQDETREQFIFDTDAILGSSYYGSDAYYGASEYNGGSDSLYQVEIRPAIQKCQSIRFEIDDLNPSHVEGAGFSMTGLLLEVGVKAGVYRLPTTKRLQAS
jgi:hypothetical protein